MINFSLDKAYERSSFLKFLRSFIDDFTPKEEQLYPQNKSKFATNIYRLGHDNSLDIEVYEIHHSSQNDARVGIAQDAFKILHTQSYSNRALVVFVPDGSEQWRLSLLQIEAEVNKKGRIEKGFSNPRRHSYLLGKNAHTKTPEQYILEKGRIRARKDGNKDLSAWEDLQSRFSVEALTKEFYDQLYHWYLWAVEPSTGVTFPNLVNTSQDDRDDIAIKIIRLITRLLFVWFIKQKKLVPEQIFDEAQLDKILANFDPQSEKDGKYYNAILQNLFFATLNNEVTKRRFMTDPFQGKSDSFGVKQLFRDSLKASWFKISHDEVIALFHHVPFMNCGLFECLDKYAKSDIGQENDLFLDGFSSRDSRQDGHFKYRAFVPNRLFFAEEHYETVTVEEKGESKPDTVKVMGLIRLLKLYNFTVQENTPAEVEVSLDPELLGQVFENLLAAYNPETKESARKSTGSFYTPRPIVEYMVNESLVAYLKTKVGPQMEPIYRSLISYEDTPEEMLPVEKKRIAILNALYECKILDPACGSGAFPMGMLQQMVHITRKLDSEFDPYLTKLRIIDNCIYGSDIQPIAMLISKLRFFISLICEQDESRINFNDPENNFGINTLPNLETKFVAANSLLQADVRNYAKDECWEDPQLVILKNELLDIRERHFAAKTQRTKLRLREEDEKKREEIRQYILENSGKPDPVLLQMYEDRIKHLTAERRMYEGENIVEEVVSTQASLFEDAQPQVVRKDVNKIQRDKIDAEIAGLRRSITKEQNKRNPVGFNAAIQQVTNWNPYDQIKAAPFFDPDWMFGVNVGFDIVIGNPPYVRLQSNSGQLASLYEGQKFETFDNNGDIYCLFYEMGCSSLKKHGTLCFITSNKWMRSGYGQKMRYFFAHNTNPIQLIDFGSTKIFENATVDTNIILFEKDENKGQTLSASLQHVQNFTIKGDILQTINDLSKCRAFFVDTPWIIGSEIEESIYEKIEAKGKPVEDWGICGYRGILSGLTNVFVIDAKRRQFLLDSCKTPDERKRTDAIIRPLVQGKDVYRYRAEVSKWLINTHNGVKRGKSSIPRIDITNYPTLKAYFDGYWKDLSKRGDKGDTPYNLRNCAYLEEFDKPKVMCKIIGCNINFFYDESGLLCNNAVNMFVGEKSRLIQLTGLLNSKLFDWYLKYTTEAEVQGGGVQLYVSSLLSTKVKLDFPKEFTEKVLSRIEGKISDDELDDYIFSVYGLSKEEKLFILNDPRVNRE